MLKITKLAILTWAILALYVVFYTDLTLEPVLANSDFLTNFYTAGKIAQEKCWEILYPAQGAAGFADEAFNAKAHALLPFMPSYSVAEYMYMPLSAYVFAPFALLGAKPTCDTCINHNKTCKIICEGGSEYEKVSE